MAQPARAVFLALVMAVVGGGCTYAYVVEPQVARALVLSSPSERAHAAIEAQRPDGTRVFVRADTVLPDSINLRGGGPVTLAARRGRPLAATGLFLDTVGAVLVGVGAMGLADSGNDDTGVQFVLYGLTASLGAGHLVPGLVLTFAGAFASPEDREDLPLLATPPAPTGSR